MKHLPNELYAVHMFGENLPISWDTKRKFNTIYFGENRIKIMIDNKTIYFALNDIKSVEISICSRLYPLGILKYYLNFYVDIKINTKYESVFVECENHDLINNFIHFLKENNIQVIDQLNLELVYSKQLSDIDRNHYFERHIKQWHKVYDIDYPRTQKPISR